MINATPTPIDGQEAGPRPPAPAPFYAPITIKSTDNADTAPSFFTPSFTSAEKAILRARRG